MAKPATGTPINLLDRVPPNDMESELSVIGSVILHPPMLDEIGTSLQASDFYDDANGTLFKTLLDMWERGRKIDTTLLVHALKAAGVFERIGGAAAIARTTQSVAHYAHATYYATRVRECSVRRQLILMSLECVREAYDDTIPYNDCLEKHESNVLSIAEGDIKNAPLDAKQLMQSALDEVDARQSGGAQDGVKTGYSGLDDILGGLRPGHLIILAARPSMGKSALALNIAEHVAIDEGQTVLFFSLEMTSLELGDRLLASRANVSAHRMRYGTINPTERKLVMESAGEISRKSLFILDDASQSVRFIAGHARRIKRQTGGLKLIVIDYLQLIEPEDRRDMREQQVARITRRLKGLAKDIECPIVCLAQLNRQADEGKGEKPRLKHLRESGSIEQDADVVLFIHREELSKQTPENNGAAELIIAKQRSGPTGTVDLTFRKEVMRFETRAASRHKELDDYNNRDNEPAFV